MRIITASTARPKKPAAAPRAEPMVMATSTRRTARGIDRRAPYRTRENTSRPSSSVPNRYRCDGATPRGANWLSGEKGASSGAKMATRAQAEMVTMPMTASGWRQGGRRAALSLRVRRSWLGPASDPGGPASGRGRRR